MCVHVWYAKAWSAEFASARSMGSEVFYNECLRQNSDKSLMQLEGLSETISICSEIGKAQQESFPRSLHRKQLRQTRDPEQAKNEPELKNRSIIGMARGSGQNKQEQASRRKKNSK